jgi:hypothetical protein
MIASNLVAAALAATQQAPVVAAPATAPVAHDRAAMAAQHGAHDMGKQDANAGANNDMVAGKMDCCKDGCACCAGKPKG